MEQFAIFSRATSVECVGRGDSHSKPEWVKVRAIINVQKTVSYTPGFLTPALRCRSLVLHATLPPPTTGFE